MVNFEERSFFKAPEGVQHFPGGGGGKVGRSKPPPVLTRGFNRLKPPRSICQKVVNTGQYESEWSIENSKGRFVVD